jgi:ferredoxin-type protein NapG
VGLTVHDSAMGPGKKRGAPDISAAVILGMRGMDKDGKGTSSRRGFFRQAAARLFNPIAEYVENFTTRTGDHALLRPPGAIDEASFLATCQRCDACVRACPADAIYLLGRSAGDATGTPVIDPDRAPCVVCDGLQCTQVCESGALATLLVPKHIRMGVAEVYDPLCLRTQGDGCTICVERCPMGTDALCLDGDGPPLVKAEGCVGCGVCQHACPTTPKAIVVKPNERR